MNQLDQMVRKSRMSSYVPSTAGTTGPGKITSAPPSSGTPSNQITASQNVNNALHPENTFQSLKPAPQMRGTDPSADQAAGGGGGAVPDAPQEQNFEAPKSRATLALLILAALGIYTYYS